jgi:hypothetical protein
VLDNVVARCDDVTTGLCTISVNAYSSTVDITDFSTVGGITYSTTFDNGLTSFKDKDEDNQSDEDEDFESFDSINEDELVIYEEFEDFTDEESEVLHGYTIVTEGEAQELIQMLSEIVEAQG